MSNLDTVKATLKEGYTIRLKTICPLTDLEGMIVYCKQDDKLCLAVTLGSINKMLKKKATCIEDPHIHTKYGLLHILTIQQAATLEYKQVVVVKKNDDNIHKVYYTKDADDLGMQLSNDFASMHHESRMLIDGVDCFKTINIETGIIRQLFYVVGKSHNRRFLDLGCGIGNVTTWAATKGFKTYGLDINPLVIDKAKELEKQFNVTTEYTIGNMTDLNFLAAYIKSIDPDVVYTYTPICFTNNMQQVLDVIVDNVKPGCMIAAYLVNGAWLRRRERTFKGLSNCVVQVTD